MDYTSVIPHRSDTGTHNELLYTAFAQPCALPTLLDCALLDRLYTLPTSSRLLLRFYLGCFG